ncbi:5-(carboxyamino)imidazole ribonucleotide synthase [Undibacterium amnicola]|uniref:N5-carboxyaminoimidazole ribonucleotide synthase n=1 Tax=Undibacterium amnicola TaxID=1834038 RepID=A0ABR6XQ88_9BURK|nr:5-(carboxyamino)imidazole ribonucleotide synthase [Undibacterium amnicola]MBC3831632.1 5-(carboxyamino)imidazole ribonucleotide synthase [Undibacterium amnicola]
MSSSSINNSPQFPNTKSSMLGMVGGGQLGRMFVHEAQALGFQVMVLEPEAGSPAAHAADAHIQAAYDDAAGLQQLADACSSFTTEFENVPAASLAKLAETGFVAPSAACVSIAQDRIEEKAFFTRCAPQTGILPAPHAILRTADDLNHVSADLFPGILKTARMGYDGKGQVRVKSIEELRAAFANLNGVVCVLEKMLPLAYEVSVLVARGADGQAVVYPIAENVHRDGILFTTTVPSPHVSAEAALKTQNAALKLIADINYVGVLCIEFFVLQDGSVVVNEMAPRPHNSGHYTIDACVTSQFAQQVRAMARLPLGDVRLHSPCVMLNILGDIWFDDVEQNTERQPAWDKVLALPSAHLHLYGKAEARRARKMGHITFIAPTLEQAQDEMRQACEILGIAV